MKSTTDKEKNITASQSSPDFEVRNFGPVAQGNIKLKNLTVFTGPNNSGKSYAAMLIKAFYDSLRYRRLKAFRLPRNVNEKEWKDYLLSLEPDRKHKMDDNKAEFIRNEGEGFFMNYIGRSLNISLENAFASDIAGLSRTGNSKISFSCSCEKEEIKFLEEHEKLLLKKYSHSPLELYFSLNEKSQDKQIKQCRENRIELSFDRRVIKNSKDLKKDFVLSCIHSYFEAIASKWGLEVHYLPASRAGLITVRKEVSASEIRKKESDTSGLIRDFLGDLEGIDPDYEGKFFKYGQKAERNMTHGEIIIYEESESYGTYNLTYKKGKMEIPIHNASSTVNEIAPLVVYSKHIVSPGDILVIEEPESSLHPGAQREMARILASLVRSGLKVIITTHSDYLL